MVAFSTKKLCKHAVSYNLVLSLLILIMADIVLKSWVRTFFICAGLLNSY